MAANSKTTMRLLNSELMDIYKEPIEGCQVKLLSEENLFRWEVIIFGAANTLYEGGYFKALMNFPPDYPYSPPSMKFLTKIWHPNIFESGDICIFILDPPCPDCRCKCNNERWNPTRNVRSVLLSVVSLLNEPNVMSAANSDAAVMYRKWIDSKGEEKEYEKIVRDQVLVTQSEATKDGVKVPTTVQEYCIVTKHDTKQQTDDMFAISQEDFLFDGTRFGYDTDDSDDDYISFYDHTEYDYETCGDDTYYDSKSPNDDNEG